MPTGGSRRVGQQLGNNPMEVKQRQPHESQSSPTFIRATIICSSYCEERSQRSWTIGNLAGSEAQLVG